MAPTSRGSPLSLTLSRSSSRTGLPGRADSSPGMTPWWRAKKGRIMSCLASRTMRGDGRVLPRLKRAWRGGRTCSKSHAWAGLRQATRSLRSSPPARTSLPSATGSGMTNKRSSIRSRWPPGGCACKNPPHETSFCRRLRALVPGDLGIRLRAAELFATAHADSERAHRGYYLTALREATKRAQQNDPAAMTLLGEIYSQGLGVPRDDNKAAQWYKLAASRGDAHALFALAMFAFQGRACAPNPEEGTRLLTEAAKLGLPVAAYDLGLLYLDGHQVPQDFGRAAQLFRTAADAGNPEAQYALATLYKEGRGVPKDPAQAARLLGAASVAGNLDAMVEYAIAQFNGDGVPKNESAAAQLFLRAARRGSPIAQDRLARILMAGRGMPANPVEAVKWHLIAQAGGSSDPELDVFASKQSKDVRDAAERAARKWLATATPRS